ncbi:hypothetical protein MVEG_02306 [Podila verticillata NRRL 6337]|nr:hypothetical protein MVEG_02306 [Podila verticillata NRRL 6337]
MINIPDLDFKVAIVMGANTGLGYATAVSLAARGAHAFLACPSREKALEAIEKAKVEIRRDFSKLRAATNPKLEFLELDLNDLRKTRKSAQDFLDRGLPLHILINSSGMAGVRSPSSPFLFTMVMLDRIKKSQPSRIINVRYTGICVSQGSNRSFKCRKTVTNTASNMARNGRSKLCNVLFTKALARRLGKERVFVNLAHPGTVRTEFARNEEVQWGPTFTRIIDILTGVVFFYTVKAACLTQVYCATSPKIVNKDIRGRHFIPIANELQPNPTAEDVEAQEALWAYYEKLIQDKAPLRNKRI